jgi:hypothetical protein
MLTLSLDAVTIECEAGVARRERMLLYGGPTCAGSCVELISLRHAFATDLNRALCGGAAIFNIAHTKSATVKNSYRCEHMHRRKA